MLAVLVGYYNLLLVAVLEDVHMVQTVFLINIKLAINLIRLAVGLILEVVATVVMLGERDVLDTVLYRRCVVLTEISFQLVYLSLCRFASLVKFIIVKVLVIACTALSIIDDIVGYCHVVLTNYLLVIVSYRLDVSVY